jgi:pantothenate kinase
MPITLTYWLVMYLEGTKYDRSGVISNKIYGTGYGAIGLSSSAVASSFGKAGLHLADKPVEKKPASKTDILPILLFSFPPIIGAILQVIIKDNK